MGLLRSCEIGERQIASGLGEEEWTVTRRSVTLHRHLGVFIIERKMVSVPYYILG